MKKKISILGLVLILVLGFTGCSKSGTTEYNQAELEQYADFIIENFSMMTEADMAGFEDMSDLELELTLLNTGVPISGEDFLSMINAWNTGIGECGAFISRGEYEMETTNDGVTLTADTDFEVKDGTISFAFDEKGNMTTLTVSANYTTGEILQKAGLNTILGMGTVFVVLIFLCFVIWLLKFIPVLEKKFRKTPEAKPAEAPVTAAPVAEPEPVEEEETADDTELAAVIAAAVAAAEGTSTDGFVVRSIRRRKSNKWN